MPDEQHRDEVLTRLRKIEGQVRGVQRLVSDERPCVDVLTQVSAVISGMEKVALRLLEDHMRSSLARPGGRDQKVDDVVRAVERFLQS